MKQQDWTEEWPTEPGMYWFYGNDVDDKTAGPGEDAHFRLNTVSVRFAGKGDGKFLMYVSEGNFMYKKSASPGLWMRMEVPEIPLMDMEKYVQISSDGPSYSRWPKTFFGTPSDVAHRLAEQWGYKDDAFNEMVVNGDSITLDGGTSISITKSSAPEGATFTFSHE